MQQPPVIENLFSDVIMPIAFQLCRWRRCVALCAASALLHVLLASLIDDGEDVPPQRARAATRTVVAELRAPQTLAAAATAAPIATQRRTTPPKKRVKAGAAEPARLVQSGNKAAVAPRYRTSLPPAAELTLDVARIDAQGETWTGQALLAWQRDGPAYRLQYSGALAEMDSEGRVGALGIIPRTMTEKRRNRARTATHFGEQGNITFSATQAAVPMQDGAQDRATLPMQLAAIARADAGQLAAGVAILVGAEKDASVYRFVVQGQEEIDTGIGKLATWRLTRVLAPGSYNARMDIWLAPGHEWFPVQFRSTEANGTVTTQTIRKIVVTNAGN